MGVFKDKSNISFNSAELLFDNSHFNSCVHCFYYSCFQLIIDLLKEEYKYTNEQIENGILGGNSHNKVLTELKKCLIEGNNLSFIQEDFGRLKKSRVKADYQNKVVSKKEAEKVKQRAIKIREELNKIY